MVLTEKEVEGTVLQRIFYFVYQENGKTYYTTGKRITDRVGINMLKASSHLVNKPNVRHIKQLVFKFSKMTENGDIVDFTGCGIGFHNIPINTIIKVA